MHFFLVFFFLVSFLAGGLWWGIASIGFAHAQTHTHTRHAKVEKFSCMCTQTSCYATGRSLAVPRMHTSRYATGRSLDVIMGLVTRSWCYASWWGFVMCSSCDVLTYWWDFATLSPYWYQWNMMNIYRMENQHARPQTKNTFNSQKRSRFCDRKRCHAQTVLCQFYPSLPLCMASVRILLLGNWSKCFKDDTNLLLSSS